MPKPLAALAAAAAVAALLAATAVAGLPRPRDGREIDVPRAIAGVELGMKIKRADRAWGRAGDCGRARGRRGIRACRYEGRNERAGSAAIESARRREVSLIAIHATVERGRYVFKGRLLRFKTDDGIGLGSRRSDVRRAYPRALRAANKTGFIVKGPGRSYMTFQTLDRKRVTGIALVDGDSQGRVPAAALDSLATRP